MKTRLWKLLAVAGISALLIGGVVLTQGSRIPVSPTADDHPSNQQGADSRLQTPGFGLPTLDSPLQPGTLNPQPSPPQLPGMPPCGSAGILPPSGSSSPTAAKPSTLPGVGSLGVWG